MVIKAFPPIEIADSTGLLCVGGDLDVESLLLAYRSGIFPWPIEGELLAWFSPPERAILRLDEFHISRSLEKELKKSSFHCTIDQAFADVVRGCRESKTRKGGGGTWIMPEMIHAYEKLHEAGFAHSIECWDGKTLVGGLYGVSIGAMFAGESMFFKKPNASKMALAHLVAHLKSKGGRWIDCQVQNRHLKSLGAVELPRQEYMKLLKSAINSKKKLF